MPAYENINPTQLANQFIQLDRAPRQAVISNRNQDIQTELSAISRLRSSLLSFTNQLADYTGVGDSILSTTASSSNEDVMTATATSEAAEGSYSFEVVRQASAHQIASWIPNGTHIPTDGELIISFDGGETLALDMSTLGPDAELADVAKAINELAGNERVDASVIRREDDSYLWLSANETGGGNRFTMSFNEGSDPDSYTFNRWINRPRVREIGYDAKIELGDQRPIELKSSTNTFDNVLDGVTIDIHNVAVGERVELNIARDDSETRSNLDSFVSSYNSIVSSLRGENSALRNNSISRSVVSTMRSVISSEYEGRTMYSIGIEFNRDGQLTINSERFEAALEQDPELVDSMLSGENGLMNRMNERVGEYSSSEGILNDRRSSLQTRLAEVQQQQVRLDRLMETRYQRYISEFSNLRSTMAQLETSMPQFG